MKYILDSSGYVESASCNPISCDDKVSQEYTGSIPSGYSSLDDWILNANIRAYKITDGNLVYDSARDEALQAQWEQTDGYGAAVGKASKNLFNTNGSPILHMYVKTADNTFEDNYMATYSSYVKVEPNTTYTISKTAGKTFRVATSTNVPTDGGSVLSTTANHTGSSITITTPSNANYLLVNYYNTNNGDNIGESTMRGSIQIEQSLYKTEYEEYYSPVIAAVDSNGGVHEVGENYSTSEQVIGTWIDGKPIYRKVVNFGTLPNATTKEVSSGLTNVDTIVSLRGIAQSSSGAFPMPIVLNSTFANQTTLYYNKSNNTIQIIAGSNRSSYTGYIILEYTKG